MRISDWSSTCALPIYREEGRIPHAYQDSLGYWTIGVGRLIDKRKGGRLTNVEIDMLLANDIVDKIAEISDWPAWQAVKADPVRATALLSMRSEEHTSELQSLMRKSYAVFCLKKKIVHSYCNQISKTKTS